MDNPILASWQRWLADWAPGESWNDRFGRPEGQRRLEQYQYACGLASLAFYLRDLPVDKLAAKRREVQAQLADDSQSRDLALAIIDARVGDVTWDSAVHALLDRAEELEWRSSRRPRSFATVAKSLIPTGRRWQSWHRRLFGKRQLPPTEQEPPQGPPPRPSFDLERYLADDLLLETNVYLAEDRPWLALFSDASLAAVMADRLEQLTPAQAADLLAGGLRAFGDQALLDSARCAVAARAAGETATREIRLLRRHGQFLGQRALSDRARQ